MAAMRKAQLRLFAVGRRHGFAQGFGQAAAVHHAGQGIAIAEEAQVLVAAVAVIDAADGAEDFRRPAVLSAKPLAAVLKPDGAAAGAAIGAEQIFDLEGNAVALVDGVAAHDRVVAAGEIVARRGDWHRRGRSRRRPACSRGPPPMLAAPGDGVGFGDPVIGGLAHGFARRAGCAAGTVQSLIVAETGGRRFRRRRVRGPVNSSVRKENAVCGVVFGAQEASKSLRRIHAGKLAEQS